MSINVCWQYNGGLPSFFVPIFSPETPGIMRTIRSEAVTAVLKKLSSEVYGYANAARMNRTLARRKCEQPLAGEAPDGELAARDWKDFVMPYGGHFIGNAQGRSSSACSTSGGILAGLEKTDHRGLTLGLHAGFGGRHQSVSTWHDASVNSGVFAGVHEQFALEGLDGFYVTGSACVCVCRPQRLEYHLAPLYGRAHPIQAPRRFPSNSSAYPNLFLLDLNRLLVTPPFLSR